MCGRTRSTSILERGSILNTKFLRCGNDAIDVSGSDVEVHNVSVNGAGDKAISVGEQSTLTANQIVISSARIGVASKDRSRVNVISGHIEKADIGIAVYQKKPEFGGAFANLQRVELGEISAPYLVENGSKLMVDDSEFDVKKSGVFELIYGTASAAEGS